MSDSKSDPDSNRGSDPDSICFPDFEKPWKNSDATLTVEYCACSYQSVGDEGGDTKRQKASEAIDLLQVLYTLTGK